MEAPHESMLAKRQDRVKRQAHGEGESQRSPSRFSASGLRRPGPLAACGLVGRCSPHALMTHKRFA